MQAALLTAPRQFEIQSISDPAPKPGEIVVRVTRAGVCGSDLHFYESGRIGETVLREPFLMGHEFSGVIEDTCGIPGAPAVGTRVAVDPAVHCGVCPFCKAGRSNICPDVKFTGFPPYSGAFAELIAAPLHNIYPMPDNVPDDAGPLLETLAVAAHAVELMGGVQGKTCAVLGAGPVGALMFLILQHHGADVALVTEPVEDRRRLMKQMGCEHAIHPDSSEAIVDRLKAVTVYGPDLVFETAGEPESYQMALELTRPGGAVCIIGIYPQGALPLDFTAARRKELTVQTLRRSLPHNYPEAIRLASEGCVDLLPLATHNYPLAQIGEAFRIAERKSDGVMKALVSPNEGVKR